MDTEPTCPAPRHAMLAMTFAIAVVGAIVMSLPPREAAPSAPPAPSAPSAVSAVSTMSALSTASTARAPATAARGAPAHPRGA